MRNWRFFLIGCLLLGTLLLTRQPVLAQMGDGRFFPETGVWVRGDFLKFYLSIPKVDTVLGIAISNEINVAGGKVQYFERGRIDQISDGKSVKLQLANLGWMLMSPNEVSADVPLVSATCRFFTKTGKSVCFDFLKFYDTYNGPVYFGNPITNVEMRNGAYVQVFENSRLEFRANYPEGKQIIIADLGCEAYLKYVGPLSPKACKRQPDEIGVNQSLVSGIQVQAFVNSILLPLPSAQTLYVIVQDKDLKPIEGARVKVTIEFPGGFKEQIGSGEVTNSDGIYKLVFSVKNLNINDMVMVKVEAEYLGKVIRGFAWFRIWY